jgi:hypothetical protein
MQLVNSKLVRSVFGTLVLGALGFGTGQAFADASPEEAPPGQNCARFCTAKYGEGTQAVYVYWNGYNWVCDCIL